MDNVGFSNGNEPNNVTEQGARIVISKAEAPPCIGRPRGCLVAGYVIAQGQMGGYPSHQFEERVRPVPGDHGTFGVLVVILDTVADQAFDLIVKYTIDGEPAPTVMSPNRLEPESQFRIPIAAGARTGQTAFEVSPLTPASELLITVRHEDGTLLLRQTLRVLEENLETVIPDHGEPPFAEVTRHSDGKTIIIEQKLIIPL